jgi:UDP-glucose 4-epimerase
MRIFITGGAGFIGIHLCKKLFELNYDITVYDNFSNSSQQNFISLVDNKVNLIVGDILDVSKLIYSMKDHDVVIHLAAKISVVESIRDPKSTFEINVIGSQNVLNGCLKNNIKKIIAVSTAAVYQNTSNEIPLDESSLLNPSSPYGKSKLDMEILIENYTSTNNLDAVILRLFNVYGLGQSSEYAGVITKFSSDIDNETHLTIFGDGTQTRDFIYVDDVLQSLVLSLEKNISGIFNIASGNSTSILDLANLMIFQSGKPLKLQFLSSLPGEIKFSSSSIQKAKKYLKFIPKFNISEGLQKLRN